LTMEKHNNIVVLWFLRLILGQAIYLPACTTRPGARLPRALAVTDIALA
jgi:hypothetical protein